MRVGYFFSAIFDQYVAISRKRCILDTNSYYRTLIVNHRQAIDSNGVTFDALHSP